MNSKIKLNILYDLYNLSKLPNKLPEKIQNKLPNKILSKLPKIMDNNKRVYL